MRRHIGQNMISSAAANRLFCTSTDERGDLLFCFYGYPLHADYHQRNRLRTAAALHSFSYNTERPSSAADRTLHLVNQTHCLDRRQRIDIRV